MLFDGRVYRISQDLVRSSSGSRLGAATVHALLSGQFLVIYTSDLLHHCYADDAQLLFFCKPQESAAPKLRVFSCIDDRAHWMALDRLKISPAKSELLPCALRLVDFIKSTAVFCVSTTGTLCLPRPYGTSAPSSTLRWALQPTSIDWCARDAPDATSACDTAVDINFDGNAVS